jgi:hypothetical protein
MESIALSRFNMQVNPAWETICPKENPIPPRFRLKQPHMGVYHFLY